MAIYQHILVPVDLSDDSDNLIARAFDIAEKMDSTISLLHVVEQPATYGGAWGTWDTTGLEAQILEQSNNKLAEIAAKHGIASERCHLEHGLPKIHIHEFADNHGVDLVVIGSHGRQGVQLLLGSTANAVLHGANCDVLAVRV